MANEAAGLKKKNPTIRTPRALGCYVTLAKPRAMEEGKEPEYGLALLWTTEQDISEIRDAINTAAVNKWGPNAPKLLGTKLKTPLKDGNLKTDDEGTIDPIYKDKVYLNARSKQRIVVVDHTSQPVEPSSLYSGMYFQAQLSFYAYEYKGPTGKGAVQSRGIGCGLQNLMVVGRGKRIDGRETPQQAFKDFVPDVMPDVDDLDDLIGGNDNIPF